MEATTTTDGTRPPIPAALMAEMEAAIDRVLRGIRDPEDMREAAERMDRDREAMRQRVGEVEIAVDLIRENRDEE
jgi:hypothetical protein